MSSRDAIDPAHLLRAVLHDSVAARVLELCGSQPAELWITLDRRWLAQVDVVDPELLHARGIEVAQVLRDLGPEDGGVSFQQRWAGRQVSPAARAVLVGALREAAKMRAERVTSWHLLVGLVETRDPLVAATFAEHGIRPRDVRRVSRRLGRRA